VKEKENLLKNLIYDIIYMYVGFPTNKFWAEEEYNATEHCKAGVRKFFA
jgi:hypothetical protein